MNTVAALIGALLFAGATVGVYLALDVGWIALGVVGGVALVGYIVGKFTAMTKFGEGVRGALIGTNAAANTIVIAGLLELAGQSEVGWGIGAGLGVLNFLAVFGPVSRSEFYQGVLGWLCMLFPMAWLVVALGFLFYGFNLFCHLIFLICRAQFLKVLGMRVDWKTGTFFTRGGLVANLNPIDTAFNMGNFSFVDKNSSQWHVDHEAGHTLNLAAFGSIFHLIGAIDENLTGAGHNAYAERLAESNDPATTQPNIIPMWI